MANLKGCGCMRCRQGLHSKAGGCTAKQVTHRARRRVKEVLAKGQFDKVDELKTASVPYTD